MADTSERTHGSGIRNGMTAPSDAQKLPDADSEDNRRKGESPRVAAEGGDKAPQKKNEKG